jgi:hypothetical protein
MAGFQPVSGVYPWLRASSQGKDPMPQFVPADDLGVGVAENPKLSRSEILELWAAFEQQVEQWEQSKTPVLVEWEGGYSRSFEPLEPALIDLMASLQDGTAVDRAAWSVVLAIDSFIKACTEWAEAVKQNPRHVDPSGGKAVWDAYREVRPACTDTTPEKLESVASLLSLRGMTAQHVAIIYDWYDESGNPDIDRVEDERCSPGKHTAGMRNPAKVKREKEVEAQWKRRCEEFGGYDPSIFDGSEQTEQPRKDPPAPESYEELLSLPGMTLQQVADMKHVTVEEVREHAQQIALMNSDVARVVNAEMAAESLRVDGDRLSARAAVQAAVMETYPELTINERIWAMSDDGWNVGRIAAGLRAHGASASYEQVLRVLAEKPEIANVRSTSTEETKTASQVSEGAGRRGKTKGRADKTKTPAESA